jgi:transposase InsO family protein
VVVDHDVQVLPGPNELWVADLSYLRCWQGIVFFSFVLDAFSRMIVGWQLASDMRTDLVLDQRKSSFRRWSLGDYARQRGRC